MRQREFTRYIQLCVQFCEAWFRPENAIWPTARSSITLNAHSNQQVLNVVRDLLG